MHDVVSQPWPQCFLEIKHPTLMETHTFGIERRSIVLSLYGIPCLMKPLEPEQKKRPTPLELSVDLLC